MKENQLSGRKGGLNITSDDAMNQGVSNEEDSSFYNELKTPTG